jgi:hypothetical protein
MVKGVPYKLRVERGQSLNSFLIYLFKSVRNPKPKATSSTSSSLVTNFEDITQKKLNTSEFSNADAGVKSKMNLLNTNKKQSATSMTTLAERKEEDASLVPPFVSFLFISKNFSSLSLLLPSLPNINLIMFIYLKMFSHLFV